MSTDCDRKRRLLLALALVCVLGSRATAQEISYRIAAFSADITIPIGHRCMGILPTKAKQIVDPLEAHGFVITGLSKPVVLVALDWCEVRNGAYDQWRDALAKVAMTDRRRVIVSCLHQHDAPVADSGAQEYLDQVGLESELYDTKFHAACIQRVTKALGEALKTAQPITHVGIGQAKVDRVASSRRVVSKDGQVKYNRYSSSGGDPFHAAAPDGDIDPWLRTVSFWNGDKPLVALHAYATHPMSYYGRGGVSADFVGIARRQFQHRYPQAKQIYVTGCSGDVTAGKYNDGAEATRAILAQRVYDGMIAAWQATKKQAVTEIQFRNSSLEIPFHEGDAFGRAALKATLSNEDAKIGDRILAAMGLSSLDRIERGQQIDMPCLDVGSAQVVLFPGEAFVGYQLMAQQMRPDRPVISIGYGECWPGYIPTKKAFQENFGHGWRWSAAGSETNIRAALSNVLR